MLGETSDDTRIYSSLIFEMRNILQFIPRMVLPWIFLNLNEVLATVCRLMASRHLTTLLNLVVKN